MVEVRSDADLVAAIADGDRGALEELYHRHAPWVVSRLRRRCADPDVVADAVQDTFVAVWRSARRWDGRGEPAARLWGIAIRRLIGALRHRSRWLPVAQATRESGDVVGVMPAEDEVLRGLEDGDLGGALRALSPELRAVIQATVIDGLTTREAARLLRIPPGTVKTRAMRAKQQLRGALT